MAQQKEGDSASDTMDHPVHLTVSREEAKALRASVKQRQEDKDREKEMEASKYVAPLAQRWTEGVSRLGTPLEQTPGERAGELRNTFLNAPAQSGHQEGVAPPQQLD
jgi:hypothetical protein